MTPPTPYTYKRTKGQQDSRTLSKSMGGGKNAMEK